MTRRAADISVIVPARNEAAQIAGTVRAALAAVEALDAPACAEIIVVDNHSTDSTADSALETAADVRIVPGALALQAGRGQQGTHQGGQRQSSALTEK